MNKFMPIFFFAGFASLICGCNSGESTQGPPSPFTEMHGTFTAQSVMNTGDVGVYRTGCRVQGAKEHEIQADSRLHDGLNFLRQTKSVDSSGKTQFLRVAQQIIAPAPDRGYNSRMTVNASFGISDLKAGDTGQSQCQIGLDAKQKKIWRCVTKPHSFELNSASEKCSVTGISGYVENWEAGKFEFSNGITVNAYRINMRMKGTYECDGKDLGLTEQNTTLVRSNEVASTAGMFCGGTELYRSDTVKQIGGPSAYSSYEAELLSIE